MKLISISGPSGVGKTTLAKLIALGYPTAHTTILSGDAFHRWVRTSKNWEQYTHLNPYANNLKRAAKTLYRLKVGNNVKMRQYNHVTGKFDAPAFVKSAPVIIYEGLHAFYDEASSKLAEWKIYVDTDPELTKEWKMARDVSARGYTHDQVEEQLKRRKLDQKAFIEIQKIKADTVVKFVKEKGRVRLKVVRGKFLDIPEAFDDLNEFLAIANGLSSDLSLTQGAGGNFSVKSRQERLIVKASGYKASDVTADEGYVVCKKTGLDNHLGELDEKEYEHLVQSSLYYGNKRPSMELGFHALIKQKVVVHTHPVYLNAILCSKEATEVLAELFDTYIYINYHTPGHELYNNFGTYSNIGVWFLQNHGLVVAGKSAKQTLKITDSINKKCQQWLEKRKNNIAEHGHPNPQPLFPDAVVYPKELKSINDFVLGLIVSSGLTPNFLTQKEQDAILGLTAEKYRKTL